MESELNTPAEPPAELEQHDGAFRLSFLMQRALTLLDVYIETEGDGGGSPAERRTLSPCLTRTMSLTRTLGLSLTRTLSLSPRQARRRSAARCARGGCEGATGAAHLCTTRRRRSSTRRRRADGKSEARRKGAAAEDVRGGHRRRAQVESSGGERR